MKTKKLLVYVKFTVNEVNGFGSQSRAEKALDYPKNCPLPGFGEFIQIEGYRLEVLQIVHMVDPEITSIQIDCQVV